MRAVGPHAGERRLRQVARLRVGDDAKDGERQGVLRGNARGHVTFHVGRRGTRRRKQRLLLRLGDERPVDAGDADESGRGASFACRRAVHAASAR